MVIKRWWENPSIDFLALSVISTAWHIGLNSQRKYFCRGSCLLACTLLSRVTNTLVLHFSQKMASRLAFSALSHLPKYSSWCAFWRSVLHRDPPQFWLYFLPCWKPPHFPLWNSILWSGSPMLHLLVASLTLIGATILAQEATFCCIFLLWNIELCRPATGA